MLEVCKKEYQKLYLEHKNLKQKYEKQQNELLKYRNHYKGRTTNKASAPQDRKIKLIDIEFDKEKLRNLPAVQRRPKKRRYYDVYSDDGVESGDDFSNSDSESYNEKIAKNNKKAQTRNRNVAKTTIEPTTKKKRRRNNKKEL